MDIQSIEDVLSWFPDFQRMNLYLEELANFRDEPSHQKELVEQFEQYVLPRLAHQEESVNKASGDFYKEEPWLLEFTGSQGTFRNSLEIFRKEPARFSTALSRWIEFFYCLSMFCLWHKLCSDDSSQSYDGLKTTNVALANYLRDAGCQQLVRYALAKEYLQVNHQWQNLASRMKELADAIGCSAPASSNGHSVFHFVNAIHKKCFEMDSGTREAELQAKIKLLTDEKAKLEETASVWKRMQTVLTFRHVLERLPPEGTGKNESNAWADFWKDAVNEAAKPGAKNAKLAQIVKAHRKATNNSKGATGSSVQYDNAKVRNTGAGLYSRFSDEIHNYTGHFELREDQWPSLELKVLELLTPLPENIDEDGKVQWDKERLRFITL